MKAIRYLAAGLLAITGVLHIYTLTGGVTFETTVMTVFGVVYLILGFLVFRESRAGYYAGIIIPAIGGLLGLGSSLTSPAGLSTMMALLIAIDVVVILCCIYLATQVRRVLPLPHG